MKRIWSYDGTVSISKQIKRDETKICMECGGFSGHFNRCSKLKEIDLQERLNEACRNDKSHTKRLSEN